ncbi:MAG: TonB-dependent receptor [Methylococcaceae bacterium]
MKTIIYSLCLSISGIVCADSTPVEQLETMTVVSSTPLGSAVETNKIASVVQSVSAVQLQKAQSVSLADYINRYLGSVHINEAQNNPLQPDVYYRGFVASPILGLPQGLAVYVNGVRFNEPFGDSVQWDLIPNGAIDTMALYSGSNPVYGLNSLGGSISIKTKTGFSSIYDKKPKHQLEVYGGSFDRHSEELTSGGNNGTLGYFIDLRNFSEQGWRDYSPSDAKQVLGTLSWQNDKANLDLTIAATDNDLRGNGASPIQLQRENRAAVFTHPDQTVSKLFFSELSGSYFLSDKIELSANAYFRQNRVRTFNGDSSDYEQCGSLLCDGDEAVIDINANAIGFSDAIDGATNNTSMTSMRGRGGSLQAVFSHDLFKHKNSLTIGASYDNAQVHYDADTELGQLTNTRGTIGSGIYVDESKVRLHTTNESVGVYLSDNFSITDKLTLSLAGRYNHIDVQLANQYIKTGEADDLSGKHSFERFNPSIGLTYEFNRALNTYASYSESSRIPTAMELSCADVNKPCKLPNAFIADPPLKQVIARTWEAGFRGQLKNIAAKENSLTWHAGYFHTQNDNDIIFRRDLNSNFNSQGYFNNVGQTLRQGLETDASVELPHVFSSIDDWHVNLHYTYLDATFQDSFLALNPLNPEEGLRVNKGNRLPNIPEHSFKVALSVDLWRRLSIGINGIYNSEQYFRGDESNSTKPLAGYWVFNATADYKVSDNLTVFAKADNLFDAHYNSFGVYGNASEVLGDNYNDGRFVSSGAPLAGWVGIRLSL